MVKITIFGLAGTGTSSTGKNIAKILNSKFISSGDLFREKAQKNGYDLYEFSKISSQTDIYDKELDQRMKGYGETYLNLVVESRLAWYFIPDSIKIKFFCEDQVRFERISIREGISFQDAKKKTLFREKSERKRYSDYYDLEDYGLDKNFDLVIDTTQLSIEETDKIILDYLNK